METIEREHWICVLLRNTLYSLFVDIFLLLFSIIMKNSMLTLQIDWFFSAFYLHKIFVFVSVFMSVLTVSLASSFLSHKKQIIIFFVHHHNRIVCPLCSLLSHTALPLVQEVTKYLMFLTFDCLKCKMTLCFFFTQFDVPSHLRPHLMCILAVSWKIIEGYDLHYSRCVNRFA